VKSNAPLAVQQDTPEEIPCLMLQMAGRTLLVPTVSIAEMVSYSAPQPIEQAPDWLLGMVEWRNIQVPVLSFEVLNGEANPGTAIRSRLAVFNNTGVSDDLPFIALPTQAIPKLLRLSSQDIVESDENNQPFDRMRVEVEDETLVIPDISSLEQVYVEWLTRR